MGLAAMKQFCAQPPQISALQTHKAEKHPENVISARHLRQLCLSACLLAIFLRPASILELLGSQLGMESCSPRGQKAGNSLEGAFQGIPCAGTIAGQPLGPFECTLGWAWGCFHPQSAVESSPIFWPEWVGTVAEGVHARERDRGRQSMCLSM
jgi:hypothetical protein